MKRIIGVIFVIFIIAVVGACGTSPGASGTGKPSFADATKIIMVDVPGGTITGKGPGEAEANPFPEGRTVQISPFKIGVYQVTYVQYRDVMGWAASNGYTIMGEGTEGHGGSNGTSRYGTPEDRALRPVTNVGWMDAAIWCNALSERENLTPVYYLESNENEPLRDSSFPPEETIMKPDANGYRLPTEAEWNYAARGGNPNAPAWEYKYAGSDDLNEVGWYQGNSNSLGTSHPHYGVNTVGLKKPNTLGLYDMSGNVWEWCYDWYSTEVTANDDVYTVDGVVVDPAGPDMSSKGAKVFAGGGFRHSELQCSMGYRANFAPRSPSVAIGFRIVRNN